MSRGEHPFDELRRTGVRPPRLDVTFGPANDRGVADEISLAYALSDLGRMWEPKDQDREFDRAAAMWSRR